MADQILNAVIQLEAQIEQQLQSEHDRADAWLEGVRQEQQERLNLTRQEVSVKLAQCLADAAKQADEQAEIRLQREMDYCRRLEGFSDLELSEVLHRQLVKILPRQVDDHQNGKS